MSTRSPVPLGMLAEITYRCPLHCAYCSNPVNLTDFTAELGTDDWLRVLEEARALGVLQVHFSGGEPMLRRDLSTLVSRAHALGMYTNLVTSGIPMKEADVAALAAAGLDHFQLSIQDTAADHGAGGQPRRGAAGAGAHPVLRLGASQQGGAHALTRAGRRGDPGCGGREESGTATRSRSSMSSRTTTTTRRSRACTAGGCASSSSTRPARCCPAFPPRSCPGSGS